MPKEDSYIKYPSIHLDGPTVKKAVIAFPLEHDRQELLICPVCLSVSIDRSIDHRFLRDSKYFT